MFGFLMAIFGLGMYGSAIVEKNINDYSREKRFLNHAIENKQPWYVDKKFQRRDIKTNRVLWVVTKNNIDYLCYYPTQEVFLNLTQWNMDKANCEKREEAKRLELLGYHKSMDSQTKKDIFGGGNYNMVYICTKMELNEYGEETGKIYEVNQNGNCFYMRYFNVETHRFEEWFEITENEYKRRHG